MNDAGIEGRLDIELTRKQHGVAQVALSSTRPVSASRIFIGKTTGQTLSMIPALFSVCAMAQSRASLLAIGNLLQQHQPEALERARDIVVLAENAKEHLMRIQLDWPSLFDTPIEAAQLTALSRLVNDFRQTLFQRGEAFVLDAELATEHQAIAVQIEQLDAYLERQVFGIAPAQWLQIDSIDTLRDWAESTGLIAPQSVAEICEQGWTSQGLGACTELPPLDTRELLQRFEQPQAGEFIAEPQWQGTCRETTALARQMEHPLIRLLHREFHNSLMTRWVARLVELAQIPQQMRRLLEYQTDYESPVVIACEQGVAQIEAARGRLIHRVALQHEIISQYQIVAPTEWNFHPQGLLRQSLLRLKAKDGDELEKLARLMINVIDPCVGYQLRLL